MKAHFDAKDIKYVPRAEEQHIVHIAHIDRRRALLGHSIHQIAEQYRVESFEIHFPQILVEAVFT